MRKLCFGLSFVAMMMLIACGDDSGSSANDLGESSSSREAPSSSSDIAGSSVTEGSSSSESGNLNSSSSEESSPSESGDLNSSSSSSENAGSSESGGSNSSSSEESSSSSEEMSSSSISLSSSDGSIYDASANTLTDLRDGQVYRTTTIEINDAGRGIDYSEVWMAENLNFETENSWCGGGIGTTEGDCSVYGRLYMWAASVGKTEDECGFPHKCDLGDGKIRGVCPRGWHLPSMAEWEELVVAVDGSITEYDNIENTAGVKLMSSSGWEDEIGNTYNGTDAYSFSALPAGVRSYEGNYYLEGLATYLWSSTEADSENAYCVLLFFGNDYMDQYDASKGDEAFSVRCLKD